VRCRAGGYVDFYDPKADEDNTVMLEGDARAAKRMNAKRAARTGRGNRRRDRILEMAPGPTIKRRG
jgi:hypothetical protein